MKTFSKLVFYFFAAVVAILVALFILIQTFDWNKARPFINKKVSTAIGRNFKIGGPFSVRLARPQISSGWSSFIPRPTFAARDVEISNPDWAKRTQFAKADGIEFELQILPLFRHQIAISRISMNNPVVDLERTLDGKNTWNFQHDEHKQSKWQFDLHELWFADGIVYVFDQPTHIDMQATISTIGKSIAIGQLLNKSQGTAKSKSPPSKSETSTEINTASQNQPMPKPKGVASEPSTESRYGFNVKLEGTYRNAPLEGTGKIGSVLSLVDNQNPFPLQADIHLGNNHINLIGNLTNPAKLAAIDMQLTLAADSMADLYDLSGVALPETPKFRTSGHLTGSFSAAGKQFKYAGFTGTVGRSDLNGTLEFNTTGPRPSLAGTVQSKRLALADLGPVIGAKVAPDKTAPQSTTKTIRQNSDKALPDAVFRTDRWKAMDVNVVFSGASIIRSEALPITDMSTHIVMDNSVLTLDPLKFGVAGGSMTGKLWLNGQRQPLAGKAEISVRHIQLKQLLPTIKAMKTSLGEINGDVTLDGKGNSTAALAASADGRVKLVINDGAISNTLLETAGLNVANIVIGKLFGDETVNINCAAADFVVKRGLVETQTFAFDTTDALINVEGNINLANEKMALNVFPHTKGFRIFSLRSPLYVRGTFKKPDVGVMKGPLVARGAAALALGVINPFAALLAVLVPSNNQASPCAALTMSPQEKTLNNPSNKTSTKTSG
jgi:uncharacterized protein involved in outer membrane biogenesis